MEIELVNADAEKIQKLEFARNPVISALLLNYSVIILLPSQ